MTMSQLTYFPIFVESGFKGNLAGKPEFGETPKGETYAKLTIFLKLKKYNLVHHFFKKDFFLLLR